jgi:mRNA interferase RelE/StbE
MLRLTFRLDARKALGELQTKPFRQIAVKIFDLLINPQPPDSQQLKGSPYRRFDSGEFRVVYQVEDDLVRIVAIGKRNDDEVYDIVKRLPKP